MHNRCGFIKALMGLAGGMGKHGFPLRVVAQDYCGGDWVKYGYKVAANKK